jgi:hypothetical protein
MDPRSTVQASREAERLEAVIDAQRAEQRNAESLLSRLWDSRDALVARGTEEARARLDALDREIAAGTARVKQSLRLQAELTMRLGRAQVPG